MQTYEIIIPPLVEELIKEQAYFIALDKPSAAMKCYQRIYDELYTLENAPKRCPIAPESKHVSFEIQHLIVGEYRILFRVNDEDILIHCCPINLEDVDWVLIRETITRMDAGVEPTWAETGACKAPLCACCSASHW